MARELMQTDLTEYVYTITNADDGDGLEYIAWPVLNKTAKYVFVGAYDVRRRLDRGELEATGRVPHSKGLFIAAAARKFDHPVFVAPVWLTVREIIEEDARLAALRALESPEAAPGPRPESAP
jgi:hypothetical protein